MLTTPKKDDVVLTGVGFAGQRLDMTDRAGQEMRRRNARFSNLPAGADGATFQRRLGEADEGEETFYVSRDYMTAAAKMEISGGVSWPWTSLTQLVLT